MDHRERFPPKNSTGGPTDVPPGKVSAQKQHRWSNGWTTGKGFRPKAAPVVQRMDHRERFPPQGYTGGPTDFQVTEDGQYYIHDKRNKTGGFYTAVILEQGVEILKKYHFKLPIIGNHKLNVYLKAIRDLCGIDKPIFSHVARHTYATRCLNRGIRLEVVAKLLGHSTTRITQHYAKLLKDNILNEVKEAFEKFY